MNGKKMKKTAIAVATCGCLVLGLSAPVMAYVEPGYYTAAGPAYIREAPGGQIVGNLLEGESYLVVGSQGDWCEIDASTVHGFVYKDYLVSEYGDVGGMAYREEEEAANAPKETVTDLDIMMQATAHVNMRSTPNGTIVGVLEKGKDIHVTGNTSSCWYRCENSDGKEVYIYDDYLRPDFPQTMQATHMVNVRTGAGTNYEIEGVLGIGDKVKVSAEENNWYKFSYETTGEIGYAYADYFTVAK
ncbi:MAG: SH3 domain-containing protein [Blautia sp.]|jgi:uncharacterized protein YgiM (DUF1202 family)